MFKYTALIISFILLHVRSYGQDRFGFEAKFSDSFLIANVTNNLMGRVYVEKFEIVKHHSDSSSYGETDSGSLWRNSSNYRIFVNTFYVDSLDYEHLKSRFNRLCINATLISEQYKNDSIIDYNSLKELTYADDYFIILKREESSLLRLHSTFFESVGDFYLLFLELESCYVDKDSGSFKHLQANSRYFKKLYLNSLDFK